MKLNLAYGKLFILPYPILNMIDKKCSQCGKIFKIYSCRKDTAKYCSMECRNKNRSGKKNSFYGRKHTKESIKKMVQHPTRRRFPKGDENPTYKDWIESPKIMKNRFLELYEDSLNDTEISKELGLAISTIRHWRRSMGLKSNYRIGIAQTSQSIRKKLLKIVDKCLICGFSEKNILQLHHIDGNHDNNKIENLTLICPNCHELTHYMEKSGKYRKNKKRNEDGKFEKERT